MYLLYFVCVTTRVDAKLIRLGYEYLFARYFSNCQMCLLQKKKKKKLIKI